ncbi:MAG: S8 family serine peptidase [Maribacter sp.]
MLSTHAITSKSAILLLLCFAVSCITVQAQTSVQRSEISASYKTNVLTTLKSSLVQANVAENLRVEALAKQNHWKIRETLANGKKIELQDVGVDGSPLYYETYADEAGVTSRANTLNTNGALGLQLDGEGMQVGVWDSGVALENHVEYASRITVGDAGTEIDAHATRVTGSIISTGFKKDAKGVANKATVLTHDWKRDKIEVAEAAANGLLLSNHSYGIQAERVTDWYFGAYTKIAQDWDNIMYNAPYYLMVVAAGNAQKSSENDGPIYGSSAQGYDVLLGFTLAKNGITVAGANTVIDRNGNLTRANVSSYSSFGPVDDGRIKPDLAGNGSSIVSTDSYSNTSYNASSGTSMATPGVTGSLLLLQQYHEQLYGNYMKAATLKGLALHTADDIDQKGPDYQMGWGVMNAKSAAQVLYNKDFNSQVSEQNLANQETISFTVTAEGDGPLMASISWTDAASEYVNSGELNNTTKALVNDLDIRITQNGTTFLPWKLNPAQAGNAAVKADNTVDPFERIEIPNAKGSYTITIRHKGQLKSDTQDFSLIVTGVRMTECVLNAPEQIVLTAANSTSVELAWEGSPEGLYEVHYQEEGRQDWSIAYASDANFAFEGLTEGKMYTSKIRTFCSQNAASEFSETISFVFKGSNTLLDALGTLSLTNEIPFTVYPNPAVNEIQMNLETSDTAMYRIVSTSGLELKVASAKQTRIDVSDLPSGVYVLQVQDRGIEKSTKFYKY